MKNLENFGVQELSLQECIDANGGCWIPWAVGAAGVVVGLAVAYFTR